MSKKLNERQILSYLTEYLILTLEELKNLKALSEFNAGELLAYLDCIEILSKWKKFKMYKISDIEKHFNIT